VSVLTINWNDYKSTDACLQSLSKIAYPNYRVYIIDNGSTDGSWELLKSNYSRHILLRNEKNLGFSKGNNIAIDVALKDGCKYILLLNNDTEVTQSFLEPLVDEAEKDEKAGIVGGKLLRLLNGRQTNIIDCTGIYIDKYFRAVDRGQGKEDKGQFNKIENIFGICAACVLYKKEMLLSTAVDGEFLDSSYFSYYEDVDLCWRAGLAGWKSVYTYKSVVYHARAGRSRKVFKGDACSRDLQIREIRNRYATILKNATAMDLISRLPFFLGYELARWIYYSLKMPYLWRSMPVLFNDFKEIIRKRKFVQEKIYK